MTARSQLTRLAKAAAVASIIGGLGWSCSGASNDVAGPENTIEIRLAGSGTGVVTRDPAWITCPGDCGPMDLDAWGAGDPHRDT